LKVKSILEQRGEWFWTYLVTSLLLVGFTALVVSRLNHSAWIDDEAVFVLTARAVRQGSRLYDEVWFNYLPGFIQLLSAAFAVGGFSLSTARLSVLCCALLALLSAAGLSRSVGSLRSGVFTMLLLATAPHFLALSSAVMTEVPAAGLATGAMWTVLFYHRTQRRRWLALSGLLLAASLWVKPTMITTLVALLLTVWLTERTPQRRLVIAALLVSLIALSLVVGLLFYNPMGFLRQFVLTYVRSKAAFEFDLLKNARSLTRYFLNDKYQLSHVSLLLLGFYGWYRLRRRRPTEAILLGAWFAAVVLILLFHTPLYRHHLVQLLFPVTVLAGPGLNGVFTGLRIYRKRVWLVLPCLLLVISAAELVLNLWVDLVTLPGFEADNIEIGEEAVRHIREATHPDEHLVTDAHFIALEAGRPIPPELTNTSRMRIRTGQLTNQQLIDTARRAQPGAIVFWEKKLDSLDDFATWVTCHYALTKHFSERHRIYQPRPSMTPEDIAVTLNVDFDRGIRLLGYSTPYRPVRVGDAIELALYWKAAARPDGDFKVFVHLVDRQGAIVGQDDSIPRAGQCPTWIWQPGEVIADIHIVDMDRAGAGGPYQLVVGMYDAERRLPAFDSLGGRLPDDEVTLNISPPA